MNIVKQDLLHEKKTVFEISITEYLIAKITELDEEPVYLLERCYQVTDDEKLVPFPQHSSQRDLFLTSDVVLTIIEPSQKLLDLYNA